MEGNAVLELGLSKEILTLCAALVDNESVSCDGLVLIMQEILREIR